MPDIVCIGVPYFIGERIAGRSEVAQVRDSGIVEEIGASWVDVEPDFTAHNDPVTAVNAALAGAIAAHPDRTPLVFAGDCVSALGAMKGLQAHQPGVLWLDAHGDFNTPETTPSGFLGGMPLAMLVGRGDLALMQAIGLDPVAEDRVILSDARDLDPQEAVALRGSAVTHLAAFDDLLTVTLPDWPLYVHMDTDVVDPADLPAMSYPTPGGPSLATTAAVLRRVGQEARIAGVLFGLWNAGLAQDDRPLQATLTLVRAFLAGLSA